MENCAEISEEIVSSCDDGKLKYKLEDFEGPLDLLLEIIKKNKKNIDELRLADLTAQYLDYMKDLNKLDMDRAAEFISVMTILIEIKSKSLLPIIEEEKDEEEVDEEALLLMRIKEYKLFKEVGQNLSTFENVDRLYKEPDESVGQTKFVIKDMKLESLMDAFVGILTKIKPEDSQPEPKKINKDRFTVAEKMVSMKSYLIEKKCVDFSDLFEDGQTKSELINIFLAVLELLKLQVAQIEQNGIFENFKIIYRGE